MKRRLPLLASLLLVATITLLAIRPRDAASERAREFLAGYRVVETGLSPGAFGGRRAPMTVLASDRPYRAEVARGAATFSPSEGWVRSLPPNAPSFIHLNVSRYESLLRRAGLGSWARRELLSLSPRPGKGGGCEFVVYWDRGTFEP